MAQSMGAAQSREWGVGSGCVRLHLEGGSFAVSRNWPSLEGQQDPSMSKHQKHLIITDPDRGRVLRDGL